MTVVKKIIVEVMACKSGEVNGASTFEQLEIEFSEMMSILEKLENTLKIKIPLNEAIGIDSVAGLTGVVVKCLREKTE